jgi:putative addiction module component (TIGR02574 family)
MAQMTPQVSELLEKALTLSTQERGLLIDRLVESLDAEPAEEGVEAAWEEEIKRRVDDVRLGRVETIPGERLRDRLNTRRRDARG